MKSKNNSNLNLEISEENNSTPSDSSQSIESDSENAYDSSDSIDSLMLREDTDRLMGLHCYSSDGERSVSSSAPIMDWNCINDTIDETVDKTKADQKKIAWH